MSWFSNNKNQNGGTEKIVPPKGSKPKEKTKGGGNKPKEKANKPTRGGKRD